MFLPRVPSPSRNTPPPVQPLEWDQPKCPVLMLPSRHDSPPKDCLALTWPIVKQDEKVHVSVSPTQSIKTYSSPDASNIYHQSRAVVFDSLSGHRTVCLQNTLCYTLPPNAPKGSPFTPSMSQGSPDKTKHALFGSPSPPKHGSTLSTPGSKSFWDGSGERKASPGHKTSPTRILHSGSKSPQDQTDGGMQEFPDSQVRQRLHPKGRKDLELPRDGSSRPGRNLAGSDRYRGILEQDHPEETLSRGFLGSCFCYLTPVILLALVVTALLVWCFGAPLGLVSMFAASDRCPNVNISDVRYELERGLIGQPAASNLIIDAFSGSRFQDGDKPLVMFFHGSSGVGKTHTANIITESVFKKTKRDSCIHLFFADLFLQSEKAQSKQLYIQAVEDWINSTNKGESDTCCFSVFIFDELRDDTPQYLTQALGQSLSRLNSQYPSSQSNKGTKIFIIMTMIGSQSISEFFIANMKRGHDRHSLTIQKPNWQEPWKHLTANLDKHDPFWRWLPPDDYVRIPFLPLERVHVKQCARHSLERKNLAATEERLEWVAEQLTYFPEAWPIFSTSGCKKVAGKVNLIHVERPRTFDFKKPF